MRHIWLLLVLAASACAGPRREVRGALPPASGMTGNAGDPLAVEAWLAIAVDDVAESTDAVRVEARTRGGKVIAEDSTGRRGGGGETTLQVRLPPEQLESFLGWLERLGDVSARRVQTVDSTKTVAESDIALDNLELTLGRLRDLASRPGIGLPELLQLEREMERVRGDIEKAKAERRRLADRVVMAAVEVNLQEPSAPWTGSARAKLFPGPRAAGLLLLAPGERKALRAGGGVTLHFSRGFTFTLDVFQGPEDEPVSAFVSIGGAIYSDFLGRGRRRFLNPYLGLRTGYAYLDRSQFLLAGELGIELFKHRHVLVEVNVRMNGLLSSEPAAVLIGGAGFVVAF